MQFRYRTVLFEFQKDGLLGERFIDGDQVEEKLNRLGQAGWELISVANVRDGLFAVLKKTFKNTGNRQGAAVSGSSTSSKPRIGPGYRSTSERVPQGAQSIGEIKIE